MKKLFSKVFLSMVLLLFFFGNGYAQTIKNDAVSTNGQLQVKGLKLCNQYGNPIQLRGMSTHGIHWFESCYNEASLDALANDWDADVLRISLYVQEGGYETDPAGFTAKVAKMINMATDRGMYALVDWHQLTPGDPNFNTDKAKTFFTNIATQFKDYNNIIYDICNEPNGSDVTWPKIKNYAEAIIPVIRAIDADAPILIGTHAWASLGISMGKSAKDIVDNPLTFPNIMYTFHFYAASHKDAYYNELDWASDRLPIFVTEFGSQNYSGEGPNDFVMTQKYLDLLRRKKISWTNWNYSDDFRSGAVWKTGTCASGKWTDANLKEAGKWIKDKILNPADDFPVDPVTPPAVPSDLTAKTISKNQIDISWLDNSNDESSFRIERSADGTSGWTLIANPTTNTTSYSDTGLTPNTAYYYRVRAENSGGNSAYSNTASATTLPDGTAPEAPSILSATAVSKSQINLSWADNANNEDLFKVERSANGTSGWTSVGTTTADVTTYSDTGLTPNTTYYYRVRAENTTGNSAYSNMADATTLKDGTPPGKNIALNKTATASSLETPSFPASSAVDGNNTTRWASTEGVDPQWISIDLGATAKIDRVVLNWEVAHATAYSIEVSDDGTTWTSIYTTSNGDGKIDDLSITGNGRYIRMYGTARGTPYGYSLYEFEVYGTIGDIPPLGENIALHKTATASSLETSNFPASSAVDGNNTTRWASTEGVDPQWISIDLGATAKIDRVVLNWEVAHATAYSIEVSDDGTTWTSIYATSNGDGKIDDLSITGNGRYIRMHGTARGTPYGYSLYEFEVYGTFTNRTLNSIKPLNVSVVKAYPNPFTNTINYTFDLEKRTHITLTLFSLRGVEIDVVIDKTLPAGNHNIKYDGSSLNSGMYIYRMQLGKGKTIYNYLIK
ncbi:hypothetical protein ATO12_12685 [Aquimarina atlantica]|uniref:Endoglucanase n=1 Tax=Aquimarina atlantica TaxID=1317122 RepID=A0A023BX43_9FLAO|nr:cellulase family glycosylhydrolase [Aquimarina atlantica]EZH74616.1 hypothetical protein ATO12_12685 [Aquimarina atlantica]